MYIFHNISFCYVICWYETNSIYKLEFQFKNTSTGFFICIYIPPPTEVPLFLSNHNTCLHLTTFEIFMAKHLHAKWWCHKTPTQNSDVTKYSHKVDVTKYLHKILMSPNTYTQSGDVTKHHTQSGDVTKHPLSTHKVVMSSPQWWPLKVEVVHALCSLSRCI